MNPGLVAKIKSSILKKIDQNGAFLFLVHQVIGILYQDSGNK
jgi:hypothetical protein